MTTITKFVPFNPLSRTLPPERRCVLVMLAEKPHEGLPPACAVGYLRRHSGGPFFVTPGVGGTVTHWCDCLGDGFRTPLITDSYGMANQMHNGKRGDDE